MSFLAAALLALGVGFILAITRATLGPTPFDRVLAVNTVGTLAVLAISVYGFFDGRPALRESVLRDALINFIGTIASLKYFRFGTLGDHALPNSDEDGA